MWPARPSSAVALAAAPAAAGALWRVRALDAAARFPGREGFDGLALREVGEEGAQVVLGAFLVLVALIFSAGILLS